MGISVWDSWCLHQDGHMGSLFRGPPDLTRRCIPAISLHVFALVHTWSMIRLTLWRTLYIEMTGGYVFWYSDDGLYCPAWLCHLFPSASHWQGKKKKKKLSLDFQALFCSVAYLTGMSELGLGSMDEIKYHNIFDQIP